MNKTILYYTDSRLEESLDEAVRNQILACNLPVISVSQKRLRFGKNINAGWRERSYLNLYRQVLMGLKEIEDDTIVYLCEHDVFYHPCHFEFIPPEKNIIYYNTSRYYWQRNAPFFLKSIGKRALSQGVAYKQVWQQHIEEQVSARNLNIASPWLGSFTNFESEYPNVDIRHDGNFSTFGEFNESKKSPKFLELKYWGTPEEFQKKVQYYSVNTNTIMILRDMVKDEIVMTREKLAILFKALGFKKGAEIGVKLGTYSKMLCHSIPGLELKCIDPYLPRPDLDWDTAEKYFVVAKYLLVPYKVEQIKRDSLAVVNEVPKGELDFVYIDGDHTFNAVMQDIIVWSDRVRIGGIVSGHDYNIPDVKEAVDIYTKIHGYELFVTTPNCYGADRSASWFFAK